VASVVALMAGWVSRGSVIHAGMIDRVGDQDRTGRRTAALPTAVVVGAMKCGTSALHTYLAAHPEIAMSELKEVNYFFGPETPPPGSPETWWLHGQWHRGQEWYAAQFDGRRPVRGESSPGYTDPAHPEVAERMARVLPGVRLVYLVRDPVDRAVSQWRHHVRDGTEPRPLAEAVLDEDSQYLARSRYAERVAPFLERFPREQLLVVVQERLRADRRGELRRIFRHVGADPDFWHHDLLDEVHVGGGDDEVPAALRHRVWQRVGDDVARLRALVGDDIPEWAPPA
jgi:hypothetical protein